MSVAFTRAIEKELLQVGAKMSREITTAVKQTWKFAVRETPRDTGTAQKGWKIKTNRRSSYIPVRRKQPAPRVPAFRFRVRKHKRIYFYNNVPYMFYLEHGLSPHGYRIPLFILRRSKKFLERELNARLSRI